MKYFTALAGLIFIFSSGCVTTASLDAEKSDLHLQMGVTMLNRGQYPQAHQELLIAEKLNPSNPVVQNNLGLASFYRKRYDLAEQYMKKAISLNSKYSEARNNYARILIELERYAEAEEQLKVVIDDLTYTAFAKAYINYGLAKFKQNQFAEASALFKKALETDKTSCLGHYYLGRSMLERAENKTAAVALDRAINFCGALLTDEPQYYSALAYYRLEQKEKAVARFEEMIKTYPEGKNREKAKQLLAMIKEGQ